MNTQDWYRRAVGGVRPAGPGTTQPQAYVPQSPPPGTYVPPGYRLVPAQQEQGTITWEQLHGGQQVPNVDTRTIPRGAVTPENFLEMAKFWRGGPGKQAALDCPECGGILFRRFVGRMEAAPLCESCGYNGGWFVQGQGAVAV